MKIIFILLLFFSNIFGNDQDLSSCYCKNLKCQSLLDEKYNEFTKVKMLLLQEKIDQNNDYTKKNLEAFDKQLETFNNKLQIKSDYLDDLKTQIKLNLENFNSNLDLFYWLAFIAFILIIILGLYKNYKLYNVENDIDEYKKENLNPLIDTINNSNKQIKNTISNIELDIDNKSKIINNYESKIKEVFNGTDSDRINLEKQIIELQEELERIVTFLKSEGFNIDNDKNSIKSRKVDEAYSKQDNNETELLD